MYESDYFWVVTLVNNIVNRYYDYLTNLVFKYVKDKYSNPDGIHHYEVTQPRANKQLRSWLFTQIRVNSDTSGQSVSNREYEQREQDKKRQIRVLSPQYLGV